MVLVAGQEQVELAEQVAQAAGQVHQEQAAGQVQVVKVDSVEQAE